MVNIMDGMDGFKAEAGTFRKLLSMVVVQRCLLEITVIY